jgi:hypothetical protein
MKRLICIALAALALGSCARTDPDGKEWYNNNDATLAVGNGAFFMCTCLFTMEMPEQFCRDWVRASPNVARLGIDWQNKSVESSAFISFAAKAHWVDDHRGCVLE